MDAEQAPSRRGRLLFLAVAAACLLAAWIGVRLFRSTQRQAEGPASPIALESGPRSPAVETDLTAPQVDATPTRALVGTEELAAAEPMAPEYERDVCQVAWDLVAQLEDLAREPKTFHLAALPVIDRLTEVCSIGTSASDPASAADVGQVLADLQRIVVADPERNPLVRGAVFLALAPVIPDVAFHGTFTEWLSGHSSVPLELVRTAALAAARIGTPSPCRYPLALTKLGTLPNFGAPELPGFYPLELDRLASGRACDAIRRWLDLDDPRRKLFRLDSGAPPVAADLGPAGDYFVTVEVLLCVWGHRSLEDTVVERALLQEARVDIEPLSERSLVSLRAANFLVLALARCNEAFLDFAVAMASREDDPLSDLLGPIQGVLGEELGLVTLTRLERLRYSERSSDKADLTLALAELRVDFLRGEAHDPEQRALLLEYLCGLVSDPGLSSTVRMSAINAVAAGGSWPALRVSAAASFQSGAPLDLAAMVLEPLLAQARSDPDQRAEALALLRQFVALSPANAAQLGVESYIAELAQ